MKAFPRPNTIHPDDLGMDLRDYFAAKVIQGVLSSCDPNYLINLEDFAEKSYSMADAMMKAREK